MQVTETSSDGLKREYRIVVPNEAVESQIASRLDELGRTIRLPGFRPGKVPVQLLRRRYGPSVRGEVLESAVQDSTAEAIRERNLRPALPPKVDIVSADEGTDLEYRVSIELLPEIPEPSFSDLDLERLIVDIPDEDIDRAIERLAEQYRKSEPVERPAESGDILVVDIEGRAEDQEIPGASGKDRQIVLGSGNFIAGIEEQLMGAIAGEHRTVRVNFPEDYGAADLAGKEAAFAVDVKEVRQRAPLVVDDELGRAIGLESLAELREEVRQRMQRDYAAAVRLRLKQALLEKLAERYDFPLPPGMVDLELAAILAQHRTGAAGMAPAADVAAPSGTGDEAAADPAAGTPATGGDEAATTEYRGLAERRVRLGLLLAEVGRSNNITVTQDELNQAIIREARLYPGRERQVLDFYRRHPEGVARLRAPIFEDKVIDFILELAKPAERRVSPRELMAMNESVETEPERPDASGENAAAVIAHE
jgi:trigger factor